MSSETSLSDSEANRFGSPVLRKRKERRAATRTLARVKVSQDPPEYRSNDYDPLPSNSSFPRLLSLLPAERETDRPPYCELITPTEHEIDRHRYEALSWCWGSEKKTEYIRLQKKGRTYAKYISSNLFAALKALRYETKSRYLWVDAVCIDQDNLNEKNQQVAMMHEIYSNADRICVWLGGSSESSHVALRFIKRIAQLQSMDFLSEGKDAPKKWAALFELMQRPWFSRRWVVQEIALARKASMYCGVEKVAWEAFVIAVQSFVEFETVIQRLSEKDRRHRGVPGWFENVSALGASMLVQATEGLFRNNLNDLELGHNASRSFPEPSSNTSNATSDGEASVASMTMSYAVRNQVASMRNQMRPLLTLEYLVANLTMFDTTVAHDTIYALLALAKDTKPGANNMDNSLCAEIPDMFDMFDQRKKYRVDYNLPYVYVCKDFIHFSIKEALRTNGCQALDVICRPWATEERVLAAARRERTILQEKRMREERTKRERAHSISSVSKEKTSSMWDGGLRLPVIEVSRDDDMPLPSWVPQISEAPFVMGHRPGLAGMTLIRRNADPLVGLPRSTQRNYSAAEEKSIDIKALKFRKGRWPRADTSHLSIYVRGFQLDTVEVVGEVARNGQIPREWADLGDWPNAAGHAPNTFWRTLVADRGDQGVNPPAYYPRACDEAFRRGGIESGALDTTGIINYESNSAVAQFCRRVRDVTWNRALIKTKSGRLGLVRRDVAIGDRVCILYGCSVPLILRESPRKQEGEVSDEIKRELQFQQRRILESYRQYSQRKEKHQKRKFVSMCAIVRRWLKATDWIRTNVVAHGQLKVRKTGDGLLRVLRLALQGFSAWRCEQRAKLWAVKLQESEEWLESDVQPEDAVDELRLLSPHRKRKFDQDASSSKRLNPGARTGKPRSNAPHRHLPQNNLSHVDWWEFDIALAAGRRWKMIVERRRTILATDTWEANKEAFQQRKITEYKAFERWRRAEGKWWAQLDRKWVQLKDSNIAAVSPEALLAPPTTIRAHRPALSPIFIFADDQVRPSWIRRSNTDRLTREEGKAYERKIRENLRQRLGDDAYRSWILLGDCYIHGMMDGQAIRLQNDNNIPSTVFEIR